MNMMNSVCFLDVLDVLKFEQWYWALFASLRRVNDLIDWNWNSNVEFRLIAKIFILNELNSTEFATKQIFDLTDQLAEHEKDIFICMWLKLFLNYLFALSSKYNFSAVSKFWCWTIFIFWKRWNDVFDCMIKKTTDMMLKTFFRKILERSKN